MWCSSYPFPSTNAALGSVPKIRISLNASRSVDTKSYRIFILALRHSPAASDAGKPNPGEARQPTRRRADR